MTYQLRQYQREAVDAGAQFLLSAKKRNGIIVAPTGCGKSILVAEIAKALDGPCLVFQPSKEILEQNLQKFQGYGYRPAVYSASMGRKSVGEITLATIGSVAGNKARASKAHLFQDFPYIIVDECHTVGAKSGLYKTFFNELNVKILGMSVGPDSIVEMKGGPFREGFVGPIEEAFSLALYAGLKIRQSDEYDVIDLVEVQSRGWTGEVFDWKPCNSMIRHPADGIPVQTVRAHGHYLTTTDDHSIYRAEPGLERYPRKGKPRHYAKISCPLASDLGAGDLLLGDDGRNWDQTTERVYDLTSVAANRLPQTRTRIVCDVKAIPAETLLLYADSADRVAQVRRWRRYGSIPLHAYSSLGEHQPPATRLITEGSKVSIERFIALSEWAYMLGFFLGDGWITYEKKQVGRLGFAVEHALVPKVSRSLRSLKGVTWKVRKKNPKHKSGSTELRVCNLFVVALLTEACGRVRCHEKRIPGEWIISWPERARRKLLEGLIDSDGSVHKPDSRGRSSRYFTTTSKALAHSLMSLLRSLGVTPSLSPRKLSLGNGGMVEGGTRKIQTRLPSFTVTWSGNAESGMNSGHKGLRARLLHDDLSFSELPVKTIESAMSPRFVYDLSMHGHPSFVASGILVHNTATPYRLVSNREGTMLRWLTRTIPRIFNETIYYIQASDLFDEGYLARPEYQIVKGFDRHAVKANSTGADFDDRSLQLHFFQIHFSDKIVKVVKRLLEIGRTSVLVFTRYIPEAEYVAHHIPGAAVVTSETPKDERAALIGEFRKGRIPVIANVNCLSVGFDYPELETVVIARPTKSLALWYQMAGRVVRPFPNKQPWVVDMVGLSSEFGKIEDLKIVDGGNNKWFIENKERALTNVRFTESGSSRCGRCGKPIGFWARHESTGNAAPLERAPEGIKPNIHVQSVGGKTVYSVVAPGEGEFINHWANCQRQRIAV